MNTVVGIVTREQVDVPTALFELSAFLSACSRIEAIEMKVIQAWRMRREYDRLVAEKEANAQ